MAGLLSWVCRILDIVGRVGRGLLGVGGIRRSSGVGGLGFVILQWRGWILDLG